MIDLFDLTGKVALMTGGAGGIGREVTIGLASCGADVIIADFDTKKAEEIAQKIRTLGKKALAVGVDVTSEQSVADMVAKALEIFPTIDILINAAGTNEPRKPATEFPIEEWQRVMDINIRGTFLCSQAVGRLMVKQRSGKIINFSSVRGRYGLPEGYTAYCPSKGAVDTFTRTLACEWAKYNVLVNAVAPTLVETEVNREAINANANFAKMMMSRIPLGRWAKPGDILGPVVFFASKASDFVTGQVVYIDGGVTTW